MSEAAGKSRPVAARLALRRTHHWEAWRSALRAILDLERARNDDDAVELRPCVDTSEVVEYTLPTSLGTEEYPTRLDLALSVLFRQPGTLLILGPHAYELQGIRASWLERVEAARSKLEALREGLVAIRERLKEGDFGDGALDDLVELARRERRALFGSSIGSLDALEAFRDHISTRLRLPGPSDLGLGEGWSYEADQKRIEWWSDEFRRDGLALNRPLANDIDAHTLDLVEQINEALPSHRVLVLYTHSGKIWNVIERHRHRDREFLRRQNGISVVLRPEVAFAQAWLEEAPDEAATRLRREEIAVMLEQMKELRKLRRELLDSPAGDSAHPGSLAADVDRELQKLESTSREWKGLEKFKSNLALDLETEREEKARGMLPALRKLIWRLNDEDRAELRSLLQENLDDLVDEMGELQDQISVTFTAQVPGPSLTFVRFQDTTPESIRAILRSDPGRCTAPAAYSFRFLSGEIEEYLVDLQQQIELLSDRDPKKVEAAKSEIERQMHHNLRQHREEPEFYLLLSSIHCSVYQWFLAFTAAQLGLRKLWPEQRGQPLLQPAPEPAKAAITCELLLASALTTRYWAIHDYGDLGFVSAGFLTKAADMLHQCLELQEDPAWSAAMSEVYGQPPPDDPRIRRELAGIYSNAWEAKVPVAPHADDLAELPAEEQEDPDRLLCFLYLRLARRAYELRGADTDEMEPYYLNSLVNALTILDREEEIGERQQLVRALEATEAARSDANLLDTLAWHYHCLAERRERSGEPSEAERREARRLIELANSEAKKDSLYRKSRYYRAVFRRHHETITGGSS